MINSYTNFSARSSLGAMGDSFYEYLLKAWIQNGQTENDVRQIYDDAMRAVIEKMIRTSPGGLTYIGEIFFDQLVPKMDHLACFAGNLPRDFQRQILQCAMIRRWHVRIGRGDETR